MKHITVRPYEKGDMVAILRESEPEADQPVRREMHMRVAESVLCGPAFSFFCGDELVCCAGAKVYWPGRAEVWLCPSEAWLKQSGIEWTRKVVTWTRKVLDDLQSNYGLTRLEAPVRSDSPVNIKFVKCLGFKSEGKLEAFCPNGGDAEMYARVRRVKQ